MTEKGVGAAPPPKRVMFCFTPNGDQSDRRFTNKGTTDFAFDEFLAPLEPYRDDLLILDGLNKNYDQLGDTERADNHEQGGSGLAPWPSGEGSYPIGGTDKSIGYVLGPSADYAIGDRVLASTKVPHRHLVYRVQGTDNNIWNLASHGGPVGTQNPIPPETDPYAAYARIFNFNSDPAAEAAALRRLKMKQSALDLVVAETTALTKRLGADDRHRMEQHTEALRDIERALQAPGGGAACAAVPLGNPEDPYIDENHELMGELFFKISAMAFACDLTRVIQFNWSGNTDNRVYTNLGLSEGHHDISHKGTPESFVDIRNIHKHLWTMTTKLYEELKALPEGTSGSIWDNTVVFHWNELGQGDSHSIDDILVILAGGMGGYFKKGRYIDFAKQAAFSDALASLFQYMDFTDVKVFGDPRLASGSPLSGLT